MYLTRQPQGVHRLGNAHGQRLVEADQHVDLRMLPQQLLRRQTGFQGIGGNIDGVNALDPAVPKQHLPEALLPLPAVLGLGVGVDNAHNDFFLRRFQRGLPAHAPGRHIVRPDAHGNAFGIHVAVDDHHPDACGYGFVDGGGVFRVADGGEDDGIRPVGHGLPDVVVLYFKVLLRVRGKDGQLHVIFGFRGVRPGKNRFPELRGGGFGDQIDIVRPAALMRTGAAGKAHQQRQKNGDPLNAFHAPPPPVPSASAPLPSFPRPGRFRW